MSPNLGTISTLPCVDVPLPPDTRCDDPAYALANPTLCPQAPRFILKPGVALVCQLGEVAFRAFLVQNGVETDVTDDTQFLSSDESVAVIGVSSGKATGVGAGTAVITANYKDATAQVSMEVLLGADCCDAISVAMLVLVDQTRSMSQSFPGYGQKLDFAKAAAVEFINSVNTTKDLIGLAKFTIQTTSVLSGPVSDKAAVSGLVAGIAQTQDDTAFYDAITTAVAALNSVVADRKLLVIMSDGEDTTSSYVQSPDPIQAADNFKAAGGIILCLGIRAHAAGYSLLSALSTGGFFINAYPGTEAQSLDYLRNLRGYICGGNCTPTGDVQENQGELNYSGLTNWWLVNQYDPGFTGDWTPRVADDPNSFVDLHGNGFFDYLPGNGLYVELMSGGIPVATHHPHLVTKDAITVNAGETYRLTVRLAGNQVQADATAAAWVSVIVDGGGGTTVDLVGNIFSFPDYTHGFSTYTIEFTPVIPHDVKIAIHQYTSDCLPIVPSDPANCAGILLDSVKLESLTSGVLFSDEFENENIVYVPPKCGPGTFYHAIGEDIYGLIYGYSYGYNCYGDGCLSAPPISQTQDPAPLPNLELGITSGNYTATMNGCAKCPTGFTNIGQALAATTLNTGEDYETIIQLTSAASVRAWEIVFDLPWTADEAPPEGVLPSTLILDASVTSTVIQLTGPAASITSFHLVRNRDLIEDTNIQCNPGTLDFATLEGSNDNVNWTAIGGFMGNRFGFAGIAGTITLPSESAPFKYFRASYRACQGVLGPVITPGFIKTFGLSVSGTVSGALTFWGSADAITWKPLDSRPWITGGPLGLRLAFILPADSVAYTYFKVALGAGSSIQTGKVLSLSVFPPVGQLICQNATAGGTSPQNAADNAYADAVAASTALLNCRWVYTQTAVGVASCGDGSGQVSASATASSLNSDADALAAASYAANLAAEAKLNCP